MSNVVNYIENVLPNLVGREITILDNQAKSEVDWQDIQIVMEHYHPEMYKMSPFFDSFKLNIYESQYDVFISTVLISKTYMELRISDIDTPEFSNDSITFYANFWDSEQEFNTYNDLLHFLQKYEILYSITDLQKFEKLDLHYEKFVKFTENFEWIPSDCEYESEKDFVEFVSEDIDHNLNLVQRIYISSQPTIKKLEIEIDDKNSWEAKIKLVCNMEGIV